MRSNRDSRGLQMPDWEWREFNSEILLGVTTSPTAEDGNTSSKEHNVKLPLWVQCVAFSAANLPNESVRTLISLHQFHDIQIEDPSFYWFAMIFKVMCAGFQNPASKICLISVRFPQKFIAVSRSQQERCQKNSQTSALDSCYLSARVSCSLLRPSGETDQEHIRRFKEFKYLTL